MLAKDKHRSILPTMRVFILICAQNIRGSWGPLELNISALSHYVVRTVGLVCCLPVLSVAYQNDSARALWKMLDKTVTCNTTQRAENAKAFREIIKPACLHDCGIRVRATAEKVMMNISIPNCGMVRPLLRYTDAAWLGNSCFRKSSSSGEMVPVERDGVDSFFSVHLISCI